MITRAKFKNFKALRDVEITFDSRLTVLVGPNGSGKTSVLQGLLFLCQAAEYGPVRGSDFNVGHLPQYLTRGSGAAELFLEAEGTAGEDGTTTIVQVCPQVEDDGSGRRFHGYTTQVSGVSGGKKRWSKMGEPAGSQANGFRGAALLRLDARILAAPSHPQEVPPRLKPDGRGLASMLAYLALNQPERFESIIEVFRKVITSVKRIRFDKVQSEKFADTLLFDFVGAAGVPSAHVSTGTLHVLGLITAILGPGRHRVLLLDDLDQGLHPMAQIELVEGLRGLLEQNPDLQIVTTSHSPYVLDKLGWNEVRVTSLQDDGAAICKPLSEHPDYEKWKEAMSPGEFWSHAGEDWVKNPGLAEAASS